MISTSLSSTEVNVLERSQYVRQNALSCDFYMQTGPAVPEDGDLDPRGLSAAFADPVLRAQLTRQHFWCGDYAKSISIPGGSGKMTIAPCDGTARFVFTTSTSAHHARLIGSTISQMARSSANAVNLMALTAEVSKGKPVYATYSVAKLCSFELHPSLGAL